MSSIVNKNEPLSTKEAEELQRYLEDLRTFKASRPLPPDARKALWLIFDNIEAITIPKMIENLIPHIKEAIDNERVKANVGNSLYTTSWDDWFSDLCADIMDPDGDADARFCEQVCDDYVDEDEVQYHLERDIRFAQACNELDPRIQITRTV